MLMINQIILSLLFFNNFNMIKQQHYHMKQYLQLKSNLYIKIIMFNNIDKDMMMIKLHGTNKYYHSQQKQQNL